MGRHENMGRGGSASRTGHSPYHGKQFQLQGNSAFAFAAILSKITV
jgi:hypothetical protein